MVQQPSEVAVLQTLYSLLMADKLTCPSTGNDAGASTPAPSSPLFSLARTALAARNPRQLQQAPAEAVAVIFNLLQLPARRLVELGLVSHAAMLKSMREQLLGDPAVGGDGMNVDFSADASTTDFITSAATGAWTGAAGLTGGSNGLVTGTGAAGDAGSAMPNVKAEAPASPTLPAPSKGGPIYSLLLDCGVDMPPRQLAALMVALDVPPRAFAEAGLIPRGSLDVPPQGNQLNEVHYYRHQAGILHQHRQPNHGSSPSEHFYDMGAHAYGPRGIMGPHHHQPRREGGRMHHHGPVRAPLDNSTVAEPRFQMRAPPHDRQHRLHAMQQLGMAGQAMQVQVVPHHRGFHGSVNGRGPHGMPPTTSLNFTGPQLPQHPQQEGSRGHGGGMAPFGDATCTSHGGRFTFGGACAMNQG